MEHDIIDVPEGRKRKKDLLDVIKGLDIGYSKNPVDMICCVYFHIAVFLIQLNSPGVHWNVQ